MALRAFAASLAVLAVVCLPAAAQERGADPQAEIAAAIDLLTPDLPKDVYAGCCRHCSKGKACGDGCISRTKSCGKGPGCACD
jgi:hypothetical protein